MHSDCFEKKAVVELSILLLLCIKRVTCQADCKHQKPILNFPIFIFTWER